jgi:acetyl-CoA synthetase/medium-chain acyl-CoA synthetase
MTADDYTVAHGMTDDEEARRTFHWPVADDYNFALDAIGRWAEDSDKLAMQWIGHDGRDERYTFAEFDEESSRVAHALKTLGVRKGEPVLLMLPRVPEWWEVMLGLMKLGAVAIPCTTLLTPKDVQYRAATAEAVALVTDQAGAAKLARVRRQCPTIRTVMVVDEPGVQCPEGCVGYHPAVDVATPTWYDRVTSSSDPCLTNFTSGTVAHPTMVPHTHASYPISHTAASGRYWLELGPDDFEGHLSDSGWVDFLDAYFDALLPPPSQWCPLHPARSQTPERRRVSVSESHQRLETRRPGRGRNRPTEHHEHQSK